MKNVSVIAIRFLRQKRQSVYDAKAHAHAHAHVYEAHAHDVYEAHAHVSAMNLMTVTVEEAVMSVIAKQAVIMSVFAKDVMVVEAPQANDYVLQHAAVAVL